MRVSRRFQDYNFREYFLRKNREDFVKSTWSIEESQKLLKVLQRQTAIQDLYPCEKSIIEQKVIAKLGKV
jgi:hypothetical protein